MSRSKQHALILNRFASTNFFLFLKETNVLTVEATADMEYGEELVNDIIKGITALTTNKKALILIIAGNYSSINLEGLKALARPEAFAYAHAKAYVIRSLAQRLAANFYLHFYKPQVPVKLFTDKIAAEAWLLKNFRHLSRITE